MPRVSVVVPCYNYGRYLRECVGSVLGQDGVEADVVIVDDASPDGSADVARRLADEHDQVRAVCHDRNRGHIATFNDGLSQIDGDYAVLLSADDLLTPGSLARATSLMEAYPTVGLAYGHAVVHDGIQLPVARLHPTSWTIWQGRDWVADRCRMGRNALRSPEAVMRTSVLHAIGDYRPDLPHAADFEMWMRAAKASDVGHIGGADQAYYRIHDKNMHSVTFAAFGANGILFDFQQRLASFEAVLGESDEDQALLRVAHRSLARRALIVAIRAYHWGSAETWPVEDLASFAEKLCPRDDLRTLWAALARRRRAGPGKSGSHPLYWTREQIHKMNGKLDWWRFHQGV